MKLPYHLTTSRLYSTVILCPGTELGILRSTQVDGSLGEGRFAGSGQSVFTHQKLFLKCYLIEKVFF